MRRVPDPGNVIRTWAMGADYRRDFDRVRPWIGALREIALGYVGFEGDWMTAADYAHTILSARRREYGIFMPPD